MNIKYQAIDHRYLDLICEYIDKNFGIFTEQNKKDMLAQKLLKLMSEDDVTSISEYYHLIVSPPISEKQKQIKNKFIDTVTVHKTNFFRENNHFEFIKKNINKILHENPRILQNKEIKVWSSAASTGAEPYTLAIVLREILGPGIKIRVLGTDISPQSIRTAMNGVYKFGPEDYIPSNYVQKYFHKIENRYKVIDEIKNMVTFRVFNLMEPFPFRDKFDIIFCRNVMIYFDSKTQEQLINKFYNFTIKNGLLFIGHSESLIQIKHNYEYDEPTIYKRIK